MEKIYHRLYSRDALKMADFYAKVFFADEPKLMRLDVGSYFWRCSLIGIYQIDIFDSNLAHIPQEISYSTYYPDMVYKELIRFNCKIENAEKPKESFDAEDIDGNIIHITGKKMRGITMPILI